MGQQVQKQNLSELTLSVPKALGGTCHNGADALMTFAVVPRNRKLKAQSATLQRRSRIPYLTQFLMAQQLHTHSQVRFPADPWPTLTAETKRSAGGARHSPMRNKT